MYGRILVPIDGSDCAVTATKRALDLARSVGASVHAIYVVDESPGNVLLSSATMASLLEALHEQGVAATNDVAKLATDVPLETAIVQGVDVPGTILNYATDNDVDLIVMGTQGRHGFDHLLGSTTERLLARSSLPVLVVPQEEQATAVEPDESGAA